MAEARRTPTHHSMHSPRVGGCVGAFFQLFDWSPSKRFSSAKRLPAGMAGLLDEGFQAIQFECEMWKPLITNLRRFNTMRITTGSKLWGFAQGVEDAGDEKSLEDTGDCQHCLGIHYCGSFVSWGCVSVYSLWECPPCRSSPDGREKAATKSRSFRDDHSAATMTLQMTDKTRGGIPDFKNFLEKNSKVCDMSIAPSDEANMRAPGVVARLMGLDSLPDGPYQPRHRHSRSYSGSESFSYSENLETPVLLQDLLNHDFKTSKKSLKDKFPGFTRKAQQEQQHEKRVTGKGSALQASLRCRNEQHLSPHINPPTAIYHSLHQLVPFKHRDEKQEFLARLPHSPRHASPVLRPSKSHNQIVSPLRSPTTNKGASRLLEAAVKVLEPSLQPSMRPRASSQGRPPAGPPHRAECESGASSWKGEQCPQRKGGRSSRNPELATFNPSTSSASKVLRGRSMSRTWNGREDCESSSERVDVPNRGSVSFREPHQKDRIGKERFEKVLLEHAQSLSPPRHRHRKKAAQCADAKEEKAMGLLRTHEASVQEFKIDVRSPSPSAPRTLSGSNGVGTAHCPHQARPPFSHRRSHPDFECGVVRDAMEDAKSVTSQGPNTELPISVRASPAKGPLPKELKTSGKPDHPGRPGSKSSPANHNTSTDVALECPAAVALTSKSKSKEGVTAGEEQRMGRRAPSSQPHGQSALPSLPATGWPPPPLDQDGVRAMKVLPTLKGQQEKGAKVSGSRMFPTGSATNVDASPVGLQADNPPKSIGGSILSYGRLFGGRKDGDKPPVLKKKGAGAADMREREGGRAAEISLRPVLGRQPDLPARYAGVSPLKQIRKNNMQGFHKTRDNSGLLSEAAAAGKMKTSLQGPLGEVKGELVRVVPSQSKSAREKREASADDTQEFLVPEVRRLPKHARARSVDDVFPELPLDLDVTVLNLRKHDASTVEFDGFNLDGQNPGSLESRSIERMFGKAIVPFISPFSVASPDINFAERANGSCTPGALSNSPLIDCAQLRISATDQLLAAKDIGSPPEQVTHAKLQEWVDDLHWEDEMVARRRDILIGGRYFERRGSGESVLSVSGLSDENDSPGNACLLIASCCSLAESSTPRAHELGEMHLEGGLDEDSLTPVLLKSFVGKGERPDVDVEDAGQPSPVSILESPFHDEACTTPESSLAESERRPDEVLEDNVSSRLSHMCTRDGELHGNGHEIEVSSPAASTPEISDGDKIRQAILDISLFRSLEVYSFGYTKGQVAIGPEEEQHFVREVLSAAQFHSSPGSSPAWFDRDLAMDPSLFDRLESGDIDQADVCTNSGGFLHRSGGLWRCDRKLLFDCVNEVFALKLWCYKDPEPWLRSPVLTPRPAGQKLVEEVYEKIREWRELSSHAIDTLIDRDMSIHVGRWKDFSQEVAEVGLDIECMLWKVIIEEVVLDLAATSKRETRRQNPFPINA